MRVRKSGMNAMARKGKARPRPSPAKISSAKLAGNSNAAPIAVPRLSVLVVDDDSLVLTSTSLLLEDLGHRVIGATSGAQALALFDQGEVIDLMITDMAMPQMSGAQLAHAVRLLKPDLPIILATGYAERLEGFAAQLPRLPKPFTQLNLVEIIAQSMK